MERACRSPCDLQAGCWWHPGKTKIVYCKDANRRGDFPIISFDFLSGFHNFEPGRRDPGMERAAHGFMPAASPKALDGHQPDRSALVAFIIAATSPCRSWPRCTNPCIRGWISYYSHFYKTRLRPTLKEDRCLCHSMGAPQVQAGCAIRPRGHETGSTGYIGRTPSSSPTGLYVMATAEHREPCESRGSCTVLGAPGGETPPGDSTLSPDGDHPSVRFPPFAEGRLTVLDDISF